MVLCFHLISYLPCSLLFLVGSRGTATDSDPKRMHGLTSSYLTAMSVIHFPKSH